jgi:hypothetical protein
VPVVAAPVPPVPGVGAGGVVGSGGAVVGAAVGAGGAVVGAAVGAGGAVVGAAVGAGAVPVLGGVVAPGVGDGMPVPSPPSSWGSGYIFSSDCMKVFQMFAGNVPPATGWPRNSVRIGWNLSG